VSDSGKAFNIGFVAGICFMLFVGGVIWHQPGPTIEQWCEVMLEETK
jgi:hypothetical protein